MTTLTSEQIATARKHARNIITAGLAMYAATNPTDIDDASHYMEPSIESLGDWLDSHFTTEELGFVNDRKSLAPPAVVEHPSQDGLFQYLTAVADAFITLKISDLEH